MSYNLIIAYDLTEPGQNYDAVKGRIKDLGKWHQFQYSLFYVHSEHSPSEAANYVLGVMDSTDRLLVIDAKSGVTTTWDRPPIDAINAIWTQP